MGWLSDKVRRLKRNVKKIGDKIGDALESARDHLRDDVLPVVSLIPSPLQPAAQAYTQYYQAEQAAKARDRADRQRAADIQMVENAQVYTIPTAVSDAYIASRNVGVQTNTPGYQAQRARTGAYGFPQTASATAGIGGTSAVLVGAGVFLVFLILILFTR